MSRFYTTACYEDALFDSVTESAIISMSQVVDAPEVQITTENFAKKVMNAFKKVCETIMSWLRKLKDYLVIFKNWVVKNAKLIVAKLKGKREVKVVDSKALDDAVSKLKEEAPKVMKEIKETEKVDAEVVDDNTKVSTDNKSNDPDDFDNAIDAVCNEIIKKIAGEEASTALVVLEPTSAPKRIAMNLEESTRRCNTLEELVAGFKDVHDIERTPQRNVKTPNRPQAHGKRQRAIAKAQKLMRTAAAIAKADAQNIKAMTSFTGSEEKIPELGAEKSA